MISKIGIETVNTIAFNNVNRLTSTIKSTLEKGNSFIRSQLNPLKNNQKIINKSIISNPQILPIDQQINAHKLYSKIKPYTVNNQKVKKNIINLLNFAQIKWKQFCDLPSKSGHQYNQYLQSFKKIDAKLNTNLNRLTQQQNIQDLHLIRVQFKRIVQYLNQRSRKYIDKNKQIVNLIKKKDKQEFQQQCQQQAIKQQMLQLLDRLKNQAKNMSSDLKKDNIIISQINQKQDRQIDGLANKSKSMVDIMKNKSLGIFKLISYLGVALVVWFFTLLFIYIF